MPGYPDFGRVSKTLSDLALLKGTASTSTLLVFETVPPAQRWRLLSVYCNPTTTGAAGNRSFLLRVRDDVDATVALVPAALVLPASTAGDLTWAAGIGASVAPSGVTREVDPLPELYLLPGWDLRVEVLGGAVVTDTSVHAIMYERQSA
ncbi:MAG TPA: hypothetical protein VFA66_10205 [Gaiellaceae bacterium]|nr:hypothetical protein [Gaiellaceae bacterium]